MNTPLMFRSMPARFDSGTQLAGNSPAFASLANAAPALAKVAPAANADISSFPTALGFVALMSAYRPSGGTARGDDLSYHLADAEPGYLTQLARQIVSGDILNFHWRQSFWVPLFQFEPGTSQVKAGVTQAMQELKAAFDSWEMAVWFVQPHPILGGIRPLLVLDAQPQLVKNAARNDRFVAIG